MINDVKICFLCKKAIGKSGSEHHLFNYYDFKAKMIETFPDIANDKKKLKKVRLKWKNLKAKIPSYKVHHYCHKELEKRLSGERRDKCHFLCMEINESRRKNEKKITEV